MVHSCTFSPGLAPEWMQRSLALRIPGWLGGKGPQSPSSASPAMAGTPPTVPGCSSPNVQPGLGHCQGSRGSPSCSGHPGPGPAHPPSQQFPIPNLPSSPALWHWEAIPWLLALHALAPVPLQLSWSPFRPCKGLSALPGASPLQGNIPSSPSLAPEQRGSSPGAAPGPLWTLQQDGELSAALPVLFPHSQCAQGHPSAHLGSPAPGADPAPLPGLAPSWLLLGKLLLPRPGRFLRLRRGRVPQTGVGRARAAAAAGAASIHPGKSREGSGLPPPAMAKAQERPPALSDIQVLALTGVTLPAALLSLLGSGSVLAVTSWQGRCCHIQLRPLFLLTLADFLAATALLGTGTIPLLPAPLSVPAYAACPYGRMLTTTSYAVSFLMVVVYAFESHRTVLGGRARPPAALQERSRCLERAWQAIPYILAWLVPALTLLAQLIARGTSVADIAPVVPWDGRGSNDTFSLYCSSCLLLIHPNQDICSQSGGGKNAGLEEKIIFLLYLLLVLGCCSLLYRRVRLRCRGNAALPLLSLDRDGGFGGRSGRSVSKASLYFQLVFLLCWTPAFLLTILSFTSISPASLFVLYVSTALSVSLQGFLHCLVYAWMRENFRREVLARSPPLQSPGGIQAFYDDSLEAAP
uniref:Uncharacterized protein n=1 Tax=Corvus moneduloides TaxID=1196302 RepID=A0A8U7NCL9_CORMO